MTGPLPRSVAWRATARCVVRTGVLLARRKIAWPRRNVGRELTFADGATGRVYRETVVPGTRPSASCLLVVTFRLRLVRGRWHTVFEYESILNTPFFVGFPGFVSKLWVAHDDHGRYRGIYEWDGAERAEHYARSLWRVLELVSEPGSIDYRVFPGLRPGHVLADPGLLDRHAPEGKGTWWQLVGVT